MSCGSRRGGWNPAGVAHAASAASPRTARWTCGVPGLRRGLAAHRADRQLRRALERQERPGVAVLQVIGDLARLEQHVERHDRGAGLQDAEVGDRKPRHVRARQRDVIAGADADRVEPGGDLRRLRVELGVGEVLPGRSVIATRSGVKPRASARGRTRGSACAMAQRVCSAPVGVHEAGTLDALVGVRAERVALRLRQVLRQPRGAIAVEVGEARAERRHRDARPRPRRRRRAASPARRALQLARDRRIEQQVDQRRIAP